MPRFAANLSMLFTEHAFLDRFRAAADAGFTAVECQFPYAHPPHAVARALADADQTMVLHNLPPGDWSRGERGLAAVPGREAEFRQAVEAGIRYAQALGCRQVNCLSGVAEGPAARACLIENLKYTADALGEAGIRCLTEPINPIDMPGFLLTGMEQGAEIVREIASPNLFLQYDLYHRQRMVGGLLEAFERFRPLIAHIQLADAPGRHEPGTGEIDFACVLRALDDKGYAGYVGLEYVPQRGTLEGLGWLKTLGFGNS
ncbi:MAG: 2-oxo-tetronate isomerase [Parvibaculaceae bacterium]